MLFKTHLTMVVSTTSDQISVLRGHGEKKIYLIIRELLFADDAALVFYFEKGLQRLVSRFSQVCKVFDLVNSLSKIDILSQNTSSLLKFLFGDTHLKKN